jgi:hypothetical protein
MEKIVFNNRVKTALILFTGIVILLLLLVYINFIALHVDNITPANGSQNVDLKTPIEITFSRNIDPNNLKIQFSPNINFKVQSDPTNKKVTLTPYYPLSQNTTYTISVQSPTNFTSVFTTRTLPLDQQQGQNYQYNQGFDQEATRFKQQSGPIQALIDMRNSLPISQPSFSVRYVISNDSYVVKTSSPQGKADFLKWLQSQGVPQGQINIVYTDSTKPDFNILSDNFANQTIGAAQPLILNFSDPVKIESLEINFEPSIPVLYSFNNSLTQVTISPVETWSSGTTYKVTIKGSTQSRNNQPLTQDSSFSFQVDDYKGL